MGELIIFIASGAAVGFLIGLTGVGGGSLMTPLLILFNIPHHVAIGTDLFYAAITKAGGVVMHHRRDHIHWNVVLTLCAGSIPSSILTAAFLSEVFTGSDDYKSILTTTLGAMLIITSLVLLFKQKLQRYAATHQKQDADFVHKHRLVFTFFSGLLLGICVTLSSVGAGAFGTAVLMVLFTTMPAKHIVGTDLAHAVPLTFVAGMSHLIFLNSIDFNLLFGLLIGSIPAVYLGTKAGAYLPEKIMFNLLAVILFILGVRFVAF